MSVVLSGMVLFSCTLKKIPQKVTDTFKGTYRMERPDSILNITTRDSLPVLFLKDSSMLEIKNWEGFFLGSSGTWEVFDADDWGYRLKFKVNGDFRDYRVIRQDSVVFEVAGMVFIDAEGNKTDLSYDGLGVFIKDKPCPYIDNWID